MYILSVSEMRALESTANIAGHSYAQMMELAGQGLALAIHRRVTVKGRRVLILVGPGNNGGDGLVAARLLQETGATVTAYLTQPRNAAEDPVYRQAQERRVTMIYADADRNGEELGRLVAQCHILVDALLGTGAKSPLRGAVADILRKIQNSLAQPSPDPLTRLNTVPEPTEPRPFIVAVDGPSGLDFDAGTVDPLTLKAHLTVTFAAPKWGHFRFPGADYVGELLVANIGIPENIDMPKTSPQVATPALIREWLPPRPANAHKGTFGKALIVAGSVNYTGAAALAASAAVRAGVGLATLAIPNLLHAALAPIAPEATYLLLPHTLGVLDVPAIAVLAEKLGDYSALLLGPGLSHTAETTAFLRGLLGLEPKKRNAGFLPAASESSFSAARQFPPLVVDADGLNILSEIPDWPTLLPDETILTPHPGEMARLTGLDAAEIQENRLEMARKYAHTWKHVVVLKGAFTVIAAPSGETIVLPFANPGLSSAGTGDVLAGAMVALRAQGLPAFQAAVVGAYLHGLAGELARQRIGDAGLAASELAHLLPEARRRLM